MEKSFPIFQEWESESFPGISKIRNESGKKKQKKYDDIENTWREKGFWRKISSISQNWLTNFLA